MAELAAIQAQLQQILEENRVLLEQQQRQQEQTALLTRLAESRTELARNTKREEPRKLLVDTKGIGKPERFNNEEHTFRKWVRSVTNLVVSIFGKEFEKVLDWCLDQDGPDDITVDEVEAAHGEPDGVSGLPDIGDQLFRLLSSLTHGETEDLVIGCSNGFEAWRRIHRRWDPGRETYSEPRTCETVGKCEGRNRQLEDLFRRYENRKNEAGERERLSEDIKATSLELLAPSDIERHLLLNKGRLTTYAMMKSENDLVIESSLGSKAPISRPGAASSSDSGPAPMDVDSLINSLVKGKGSGGKGKSKGKGKDKGSGGKGSTSKDIVCFNCGKAGHKAAECWSKKKDGSNKGSSKGSKGGGKKGKSKGKHKGANSLEEEEEQPEGELDVGMFELGALTAGEDLQAMEWVRFNLDTGAAQTAIPSDWADKVPVKEGTEVMFKTASGELVRGTGTGVFKGTGEFGHCCSVTGPLAPAHKPLVSAYKCSKHGRVAVLDEHGGNLIPQDSKVSGKMLELIEKEKNKHHAKAWIPVYQEKGVYNFYLKAKAPTQGFGRQPTVV